MRTIKFRLRSRKTKEVIGYEMLFDDQWAESGNGVDWQPLTANPLAIREQFIDLKDKKGKEIYEGDIVKDELKNVWIIEWTDGGGKLLPGYQLKIVNLKGTEALVAFIGKQVEIIGNIYENKEVLEK